MCLEKFCEKCCEMHKNPVNCLLHLIAGIILACALWIHSGKLIIAAVLIAIVGHLIQISKRKGKKKKR